MRIILEFSIYFTPELITFSDITLRLFPLHKICPHATKKTEVRGLALRSMKNKKKSNFFTSFVISVWLKCAAEPSVLEVMNLEAETKVPD